MEKGKEMKRDFVLKKKETIITCVLNATFLRYFILFLGLSLLVVPIETLAKEKNQSPPLIPPKVEFRDGTVSLSVQETPLFSILDEIAKVTGVAINYKAAENSLVSVSFSEIPLEMALKKIAGDVAVEYSSIGEKGDIKIDSVTIVSSIPHEALTKRGTSAPQASKTGPGRINQLIEAVKDSSLQESVRIKAAYKLTQVSPQATAETLAEVLAGNTEKNLSYSLMSMLGRLDHENAFSTLNRTAVNHKNPTLRYKAIQSLVKSPQPISQKQNVLKKAAINDLDPHNRARAIIGLCTIGDEHLLSFLLEQHERERNPFVKDVYTQQISLLSNIQQ